MSLGTLAGTSGPGADPAPGEERSTWAALKLAARWGLDTRIGLEDTLLLPHGERAEGNAELIAAAKNLLAA
ncbi:3-keto-5-aminohexanoate cleavage protein [Paenarthrobacter sp. AMU7]|uniref:3-keto-5-aminohexanoate cleavage protein n=1 Tax=Paenarthrobacter sp. AMU7 TaxID=3162492 RepID=A0AB39YSD9_9MICC